jgi:hypothetical protein
MTDKEAMKLALEALKLLTDTEQTFGALDYGDNAITALKARLAQPEQEPEVDLRTRWPMNGWKENKSTPPQRKPLTNNEIGAIGSKIFPATWNTRHVEFARAIEAAHGIKENT